MADDDLLRRDFGAAMASPASPHVSEADWEALALHELPAHERDVILNHVITCADCSAVYRSLSALEDEARTFDTGVPVETPARSWAWAWQLAAAVFLIAAGALLVWNLELRRDRDDLVAKLSVPVAPAASPSIRAVPPIGAAINVPIIDLQPDTLRGADPGRPVASVPVDAALVTLILASDSRDTNAVYRLDVVNATGQAVWESEALRMTPYNTFTLALSPRGLGTGVFQLQLFRVNGDRREPIERYSLRVDPIR